MHKQKTQTSTSWWTEKIGKSWATALSESIREPYLKELAKRISSDRVQGLPVSPEADRVFRAYKLTDFNTVKVCVVGHAPYRDPELADGLVFGMNKAHWLPFPWELEVINRVVELDYIQGTSHFISCFWHDFTYLAEQGVMLLPRLLTTMERDINRYKEWTKFTNATVKALAERGELVFLFWGDTTHAMADQVKKRYSNSKYKVGVLKSQYPKNYNEFNDHQFSKTNKFLVKLGKAPIEWAI